VVDEANAFATPEIPLFFVGRLRHPRVPCRSIWASNPGNVGWAWVRRMFIDPSRTLPAGYPYKVAELAGWCIGIAGTMDDNKNLPANYEANIRAAAGGSESLYLMYRHGAFDVTAASYFPLSEHSLLRMTTRFSDGFRQIAAADHGSVAPYAAHFAARAEIDGALHDGTPFPQGSILIWGECTSGDAQAGYTKSRGVYTVNDIARDIMELFTRVEFPPPLISVDAAVFGRHGAADVFGVPKTLADEYRNAGLSVEPSAKGKREGGLFRMKEMLANAAPPHARKGPGLYVDPRACPALVAALGSAMSDERYPEVTSESPLRHYEDSCRYLVLHGSRGEPQALSTNIWTGVSTDLRTGRITKASLQKMREDRARFGRGASAGRLYNTTIERN